MGNVGRWVRRVGGADTTFDAARRRRFVRALEADFDWSKLGARLDATERDRARSLWIARMRDEQRAVVAMSQLVADLARLGAPLDVLGAGAAVIHDETRHVDVCERVARALDPARPFRTTPPEMPHHGTLELRHRVVVSVVSLLCVGETLSMSLLRAARDHCDDEVTTDVLEGLLADESIHSRFGWWWLETPQGELRDDERPKVARMLARLFARLDRSLGAEAPCVGDAMGAPPSPVRRDVFHAALHDTILPRLEAHGIAARAAWCDRALREAA